ncbi:MAG: hypothetical protein IPM92_04500 [Saprospiraceae bacterium]|nr:hypothetical protein [Saprospiraceae bacterium]
MPANGCNLKFADNKSFHHNIDCYGTATGSIQLQISGGTPKLNIRWLHSLDTGTLITQLLPGVYSCEIESETGHRAVYGPFVVNQAPAWTLNPLVLQADPGQMNGSISLDPTGGCPPYHFIWNTGHTTPAIHGLSPGRYCVTITDCKSCNENFCTDIVLNTSQNNLAGLKSALLFPNPAFDHLVLKLEFEKDIQAKVEMYDAYGKYMSAFPIKGKDIRVKLSLDLIPVGSYWIGIKTDDGYMWLPFTRAGN